jgi:hypothetical protein
MDDHLLRGARWTGALWGVGTALAWAIAASDGAPLVRPMALSLLFLSAPAGLAIAGWRLRRRERRAWAIHRLVDDHVEVPASELIRDSDFTAETLDRAIKDVNNSGLALLVWDRGADVVQDGRLRSRRVQIERCGACGAKVASTLPIGDVSSARCPYCHDPLGAEALIEEKARLIDELDADPSEPGRGRRMGSGFSPVLFLFMTVLFWPAAVAYAIYHWHVGD